MDQIDLSLIKALFRKGSEGPAMNQPADVERFLSARRRGGFSLIEILLVVVILGALAAMVVPRLSGRSDQAKVAVARSDIEANLATALKLYELDNGNFPTTSQGLEALMYKPDGSPLPANWNGPYIEKKPVDPWGNLYMYESPGSHRLDYDLYSQGKDTNSDEDDIVNWQ